MKKFSNGVSCIMLAIFLSELIYLYLKKKVVAVVTWKLATNYHIVAQYNTDLNNLLPRKKVGAVMTWKLATNYFSGVI